MPYRDASPISDYRDLPTPIEVPLLPASPPQVILPVRVPFWQRPGLERLSRALRQIIDPESEMAPLCIRVVREPFEGKHRYIGEVEIPPLLPGAPRFFSFPLTDDERLSPRALRSVGRRLRSAWRDHFLGLEKQRVSHRLKKLRLDPAALEQLLSRQPVRCPKCDRLAYERSKVTLLEVKDLSILLRRYTESCRRCGFTQREEELICPRCAQPVVAVNRSLHPIDTTPFTEPEGFCETYRWRCTVCSFFSNATRVFPGWEEGE